MTETPVVGPDIIEIQPCTEEGLVTLEAKLGGKTEAEFFDAQLLCRYINATPLFTKQRCSAEMGYGVAERNGRNVHAFKTGKVIVRRAEGREMALEHLHLISRSLWPALKVRGGSALVDCLASEGGCPAFPKPPAEGGEIPTSRSFAQALGDARGQPRWNLIEEGLGQLRAIAAAYPQTGVTKATKEQFRKAEGPIIGFIVETEDVKRAALGIPFLSASLMLDRAMQECEKLAVEKRVGAWSPIIQAFNAIFPSEGKSTADLASNLTAVLDASGSGATQSFSIRRLIQTRIP